MKDKLLKLKDLIKEHKKLSIISISISVIFIVCCGVFIKSYQNNIETSRQLELYKAKAQAELDPSLQRIKAEMEENNKQMEDLASSMKLVVTNTEETNYSGNYHDINLTVRNISSSTVNYAKVEIYFKDEKGNIIQNDSVTTDATIKPDATQTITKTVSNDIKYKEIYAEVSKTK